MSRVSENSTTQTLNFSIGKTKRRLEDLNLSGASLKKITKPSDDPSGSIGVLTIRSSNVDISQYNRNINFARTSLAFTESAIEDLSNIIGKAKEISLGQASDLYNPEVRQNVAREIHQLKKQAISIGNRRLGNRFIFAGHKTLSKPFSENGHYNGDDGNIHLEVSKDYFIPINLTGQQVFFSQGDKNEGQRDAVSGKEFEKEIIQEKIYPESTEEIDIGRELASVKKDDINVTKKDGIITQLDTLETALMSNDPDLIQDLLPRLDETYNQLITLRTRIGALTNAVDNAEISLEKTKIINEEHKSRMEDADVAELFTDINKQKNILQATYKVGSTSLNRSLLDFIR